jgi:hypothetical protein
MIHRILFGLLIVPVCLAQTNQSPKASSQPDDISAITAQANQGNSDAQIKLADAYLRGRGSRLDRARPITATLAIWSKLR